MGAKEASLEKEKKTSKDLKSKLQNSDDLVKALTSGSSHVEGENKNNTFIGDFNSGYKHWNNRPQIGTNSLTLSTT